MIRRRRRTATALAVVAAALLSACGDGDDAASGAERGPDGLAGFRRDPAPDVGQFSLPDLANGGADFALRADPGELLVVYFGFTHCPDFCPTTLSDLKLARNRLDEADAARVDVAMATVDPERDLPVLADYIGSFFEDGKALGTDDAALLSRVAAPFGVGYDVYETANGTQVDHTTFLYAVDDEGKLTLSWQFGITIDDLASDLEILLDEASA